MTLSDSEEVVAAQDYYPFGEVLRGLPPASTTDKYMFTEKESAFVKIITTVDRRHTETNYDYFACQPKSTVRKSGARFYDSEFSRWLQVDPFADKYPG